MQQIETLYLPNLNRDTDNQDLYLVRNHDEIQSTSPYYYGPLSQLNSLSRVNILVGANNSGKSRFMRLLAVEQMFDIRFKDDNINKEYEELVNTIKSIRDIIDENQNYLLDIKIISDIKDIIDKSRYYIKTNNKNLFSEITELLADIFMNFETKLMKFDKGRMIPDLDISFINNLHNDAKQGLASLREIKNKIGGDFILSYYIPTLRGLRPLDSNYTDFYKQQTIDSYFKDAEYKPEVFTGLGLYTELRHYLLGDNAKRTRIKEYQEFISRSLFEGKEVTLIPSEEQKIVVVKIGNELERPIHELGDGIQSAIILTFLPFIEDKNCIFFIEEPEIFLHPSMQRKILEFYHSLDRHLFFMTTHSNHLLDITIDIPEISIYSFRKLLTSSDDDQTPQFVVENVDNNQSSSLELLGVRNSSVLLVNATIWVEGITDRWYLREMLRMYMETLPNPKPKLEEDIHYAFVEYGGGNITHFSFLDMEEHPIIVDRLCAKAIVIIDQDDERKKLERKQKLEDKLGERLIILPCREIENSLPPEVIRSVVIDYERSQTNPNPVIQPFTYSSYRTKYLGNFIQNELLKPKPNRNKGYAEKSGTIKDKLKFCEKALVYLKTMSFSQLDPKIQAEIKKLYEFILAQNLI